MTSPETLSGGSLAPEPGDLESRVLAIGAKILCSALFVSGRERDEALETSVTPRTGRRTIADVDVDRERGIVTLRGPGGGTGAARFCGDQGATILPPDSTKIGFTPVPVGSALPDPQAQPWPLGDAETQTTPDPELEAACDEAFHPDAHTAAFLVVHRGRIVAERYASGIGPHTQLESWSMGKSVTATLVGLLVREGCFGLNDPAPIPDWQDGPRGGIRVRDLMQMSSGLRFTGPEDAERRGLPDHVRIYMEALDAFRFAVDRPLEHPPGTVGRYRNCDPLALGLLVREAVDDYLTWPQRTLFDRIGIRRQVLECDWHGNFLLTGFDYGTARNWARLGLLYLWDGVFAGDRILPEGWTSFVSTPAPAWERPEYGGLFWLNRTNEWALPGGAFFMGGDGVQRTFVVPSLDLVVVRLGHVRGARPTEDHPDDGGPAKAALDAALERIAAALS